KLRAGSLFARVVSLFGASDESWAVETPNAVAGVRGTAFHVGVPDETSTAVAVTEGKVALAAGEGEVAIPAGFSATASGTSPGELTALLPAPTSLRPVNGRFRDAVTLSFTRVENAKHYRIEIASDPQFLSLQHEKETAAATVRVELDAGTYFWRVVALSETGVPGTPSKLYRFSVE
ncbi:MAG: FecR domain-containing protein, partial [Myxococcota bacterium]